MIIYLILIASILSYLYDINYNSNYKNCKKVSFNLLLFFHHFLASFLIFGWLSNDVKFLKIYVCTVAVVYISWILFSDYCLLTVYTNRLCNIPEDIPFESLYSKIIRRFFGSSSKTKSISEYIIFPILIVIGLIKIEKRMKRI